VDWPVFERFWSRIFVEFLLALSWYGAGEFIEWPVPPHPQTMEIEDTQVPFAGERSKQIGHDHREINPTTHSLNSFERRLFFRSSILTLGNISI